MKPFALTQKAKSDLRAIAIYTEEHWGKDLHNFYIKRLPGHSKPIAESAESLTEIVVIHGIRI